jgi:hypothetical protein
MGQLGGRRDQLAQAADVGILVGGVAAKLGGAHANLLPGGASAFERLDGAGDVTGADAGARQQHVGAKGGIAAAAAGGALTHAAEREQPFGRNRVAQLERHAHGAGDPGVNLVGGIGQRPATGQGGSSGCRIAGLGQPFGEVERRVQPLMRRRAGERLDAALIGGDGSGALATAASEIAGEEAGVAELARGRDRTRHRFGFGGSALGALEIAHR